MTEGTDAPATATLRDGAVLKYRIVAGQGPARFLLIHPLAMEGAFWQPVAARLTKAGSVLLPDCRGHGRSSKTGAPFTVEQFADDVDELLAAIGWTDVIVAGASMGGCVALAFAAAHADKLRGLGLIDTTASYGPEAPAQWEERAQKARASGMEALVAFQKDRWFSRGFADSHPEILERCIRTFLANDVSAYVEVCRMLGRADLRAALPDITVPVRILVGSNDYATPLAMAEAMQRAIPGATLEVLDGAAHLTPLECGDAVVRMLLNLAEVPA